MEFLKHETASRLLDWFGNRYCGMIIGEREKSRLSKGLTQVPVSRNVIVPIPDSRNFQTLLRERDNGYTLSLRKIVPTSLDFPIPNIPILKNLLTNNRLKRSAEKSPEEYFLIAKLQIEDLLKDKVTLRPLISVVGERGNDLFKLEMKFEHSYGARFLGYFPLRRETNATLIYEDL